MGKALHVTGYEAYKDALDNFKGKTIFALFSGSVGEDGKSWCSDCVAADPVIERNLCKLPDDAVFIHCVVGDRTFWKDRDNVFRKSPDLLLTSVPTLLRLGTPQRLSEDQCASDDLVSMLFTDD